MLILNRARGSPCVISHTKQSLKFKTKKMKTISSKLSFAAIVGMAFASMSIIQSCSSSNNAPSGPPPVTDIGGYPSSDSVAPANLIAYWNFDGTPNEQHLGLPGTANGVTYVSGVRNQAYQGDSGAYVTVAIPPADSTVFEHLGSYSVSFWYNMADEPYDTLGTNDPAGIFFMSGNGSIGNDQAELIYEFEHFGNGGDTVNFHNGFNNVGNTTASYQLFVMNAQDTLGLGHWVHMAATYNDTTSTYIVYEDGNEIMNQAAWGLNLVNILYQQQAQTPPLQGPITYAGDIPTTFIIGTWPAGLFGVSPAIGQHGWFLGQLDELRLFNIALSQQQVSGLYLNGAAGR
jgi:hypothetical protein